MASRTQLRLQQVTGSFANLKTEAAQYITPAAATALTGSDLQDLLGAMAASLNRIHGAASDEPFNNLAGIIRSDSNQAGAIKLHADQGGSQTISLLNDEGTGNNAIDVEATAGGINLQFAASKQGQLENATSDLFVKLVDDAANLANEKITIKNTNGTDEGAITIDTDAGGIDIDAAKSIHVTSAEAQGDAIKLEATANGGIDISAGNAANDANANIDFVAMNKLTIDAQGTDSGDGVEITLGTDTGVVALKVKNDSGTDMHIFDAIGDAEINRDLSVGRNLTITGDLDVNGTTTTIDSVNLSVQDSIIALGVSGSGAYSTVGDRGILFPRGSEGSITHGLFLKGADDLFILGKSLTGPTSASFATVGAANFSTLKAGTLLPGADDTYDLGSTSLAWQDLHLEGDVLMTDAGKVETTAGDLTISSAAAQVVVDAETDIELNAKGNNIFIKKDSSEVFELTSMDPGSGQLIGILSASQGNLALVSAAGSGEIHLAQGPFTINSATLDIVHSATRKVQFKMGNLQEARVRLELDDQNAASCLHDLSGSLLLDDGANAGEIRFQEAGTGNNYVGLTAADEIGSDITFTLPSAFPASSGQAVVSSDAGILSFAEIPGATTKGIKILTSGISAGSDVNFNAVDVGSTISGLTTNADDASVDVFVNGQLLVSGSEAERSAGTRDFRIKSATVLTFAFDLEVDDVVQVVKRG